MNTRSQSLGHVYVIDDNSELRKSLHVLLGTAGITTWPFAAAADFLDQIDTLAPAPILLDIRMPDIDGIGVMKKLASLGVEWPVIILTAHGDVSVAVQLMKLGAIDFLEKPFEIEDIELALERAFDLLATANEANSKLTSARDKFSSLTPREAEIVEALLRGQPNKNVAANLGLSIRTVEMHRAHALAKLGARNVVEAGALATLAHWPDRVKAGSIG